MFSLNAATTPVFNMNDPINILSLSLGVFVAVLLDLPCFYVFRRRFPRVYIVCVEVMMIVFWLFELTLPFISSVAALIVGVMFFFFANQAEFRTLVANNMRGKYKPFKLFGHKQEAEVLFDRDAVYNAISDAVLVMSEQKVGAIITIEKKDPLDQFIKNGTLIEAPVSSELLQTIFYKGTRLHDGAVIIRNGTIVAAAVAYLPTTRPLPGKYGLRHRAAIGISEEVDAVTVVVSEETGRISIAYQGSLDAVNPKQFRARLEELLSVTDKDDSEEEK